MLFTGPLQQAAIEEGIKDIERHTCVKFRYREPEETVYVRLTVSDCNLIPKKSTLTASRFI